MLVRCCSKLWLSSHQIATAGGLWWHVNPKRLQGFGEKCPRNIWGTICCTYIKFIAAVVVRGQNSRLRDIKTSLSVLRGTAMT